MKIKVIDYAPGSGKTSYITKYMTQNPQNKYLYITPLLSEAIGRVAADCSSLDMVSPDDSEGLKSEHISKLLKEGKHISSTHSMFKKLKQEHIELIREYGYVIILDEVVDYIAPYEKYKHVDICDLFDSGVLSVQTSELGRVYFNNSALQVSDGAYYEDLKILCDVGMLYSTTKPANLLNIQIPPSVLQAAQEVIVMTYLFESSGMYAFFKLHHFDFEYLHIPELKERENTSMRNIKSRLQFVDIKSADKVIGNYRDSTALSYTWWDRAVKEGVAKDYMKSISVFLKAHPELSKSFYFCCPKSIVDSDKGRSTLVKYKYQYLVNTDQYTNEFGKPVDKPDSSEDISDVLDGTVFPPKWISVTTKATNNYRKRKFFMCLSNIYPNMNIQYYLGNYSEKIDEDKYALAEVLQVLYRGCIRDPEGGNMSVYLGSKRMRNILVEWLDSIN